MIVRRSRAAWSTGERLKNGLPLLAIFIVVCFTGGVAIGDDRLPQRRALLIGVGQYPHLPESLQLRGPVNDVRLLEHVLTSRVGFLADQIVTLTDDSPADRLPTRANILEAFRELANDLRVGDEVFVYFSGHGTQQPDQPGDDHDDDELDGLDEVPCARDVTRITVQEGRDIPGGIVDDEIGLRLEQILATGANVWMVLDCCHSGTATRGDETIRRIPPRELLPEKALSAARNATRGASSRRDSFGIRTAETRAAATANDFGSLVVLYAALSNEPTVEKRLPRTGADRKPHGLLTFNLAQLLSRNSSAMSYQTVNDELTAMYLGDGRTSPTPWMEGADLGLRVLGGPGDSSGTRLRLNIDRQGRAVATVGTIDGVAPETIFAVLDDDKNIVAHARVVEAGPFESMLEPCAHDDGQVRPLPKTGALRIVTHAGVADRLRLHASPDFADVLTAISRNHAWPAGIEQSTTAADADLSISGVDGAWVLKSVGDGVVIGTWPMAGFSSSQLAEVEEALVARWRVKRLLDLTTNLGEQSAEEGPAAICLKTNVIAFEDAKDRRGTVLTNLSELTNGEIVAFEVVNEGGTPFDLTLLLVDVTGRLQAVFPRHGREGDARLPAGKTLRTPRAVVEATTAGVEHLLVIAAAADGGPCTFAWIAEPPSLVETETVTRGETATALHEALRGLGSVRGAAGRKLRFQRLSWRVTP